MTSGSRPLFGFSSKERRDYESTSLRLIAAAHVENYLDNAGLQAKDLAARIGKSRAWVSKLLSGRQNATLDTLAEVAWALGARWQIGLAAAERTGTPAEDDRQPPDWGSTHVTQKPDTLAHNVPKAMEMSNTKGVSAQASEHDGHDLICLRGETAVAVPMHEYRTLKALRDRATPREVDEAQTDAAITEYEDWVATGRPGEMSHEAAMARLLTEQ